VKLPARVRFWLTALAAVLLAGSIIDSVVVRRELSATFDALEESTVTVAQLSSELAVTREDAAMLVATLGVLQARDLRQTQLGSDDGGPRGRALVSASRGIVLLAENLPTLPVNRLYQVQWQTNEGQVEVGTLVPNPFGMATFVAHAGAPSPVGARIVVVERRAGTQTGEAVRQVLAEIDPDH
jgi:hypothetical protein